MKNPNEPTKNIEDMTIKEAVTHDIAQVVVNSTIISDPAPVNIPITPIVIGKKILNGTKKIFKGLK